MFKKGFLIGLLLCCALVFAGCGGAETAARSDGNTVEQQLSLKAGMTAPDLALTSFGGQAVQLATLYQDKPVYLNFWASWCPPCVRELPDIERAYETYGKDVHFAAVAIDAKSDDAAAFLERKNFTMPAYYAAGEQVNRDYHVDAVPLSLLIATGGRIVAVRIGAMTGKELAEFLAPALDK